MKKLVAIALLILASFLTSPFSTHPAHGLLTGVICLTRASSSSCPQVPLTFNATTVGSSFTIGVFVSNSEAMGGFDIYVSVDRTYLNPTAAALGSLIASPSLTSICINGIPTAGTCTTNSANGAGVVEVTTIEGSGSNECGGISPCSGMAFTITYQVVGLTSSTPIFYPTNPACSNSSVSSPPDVCVLVAEAIAGGALPETTLAGDFTDQTPTANFAATPTSGLAPLPVDFDATLSNATAGNTITSYNWAFGDGIIANLTGPTLSPTTSHTYNTPGAYVPNLETVDISGKSSIKYGPTITVVQPDFSIGANPTALSVLQGNNRNTTITLTSLSGFSGTVSLSANSSTTLGITSTLNKTSVSLAGGQTDSSTRLTIAAAASTPLGSYTINVTGTSGTHNHSVFIDVTVVSGDYSISNSGNISLLRGSSGTNTITARLLVGTGQPVTLSCIAATLPMGASCSFNPVSIVPTMSGTSSVLTITTTGSTPASSSIIKVSGSPRAPSTLNTTFTLIVSDFQISANQPSISVPEGGNGNSVITLNSQSGFNGNIDLAAQPGSASIIGFLNRTSVMVTAGGSNSSTLYIIVQTGTAPGSYPILVTGTVGSLTHSFTVTVNVPVPNFGASATPTSLSVKTGANGTSVITLIGLNGFTGNISLGAKAPPSVGITPIFSNSSVLITGTSGPVASTLTISTSATTQAGTYTINVNATSANIQQLVNITLTVVSPLPSIQVGAASLSTVSIAGGKTVDMTVTVSNTGSIPVNITLTMDVNSGSGSNITVAQETLTLNPGQAAQTIKLTWNSTQWAGGNYQVYARIIGSQTNTINQAQSAGRVALTAPPTSPGPGDLSVIPWITTAILAAIAAVLGLLLIRRKRPTGLAGSL